MTFCHVFFCSTPLLVSDGFLKRSSTLCVTEQFPTSAYYSVRGFRSTEFMDFLSLSCRNGCSKNLFPFSSLILQYFQYCSICSALRWNFLPDAGFGTSVNFSLISTAGSILADLPHLLCLDARSSITWRQTGQIIFQNYQRKRKRFSVSF